MTESLFSGIDRIRCDGPDNDDPAPFRCCHADRAVHARAIGAPGPKSSSGRPEMLGRFVAPRVEGVL